jgi:hypothetical protein
VCAALCAQCPCPNSWKGDLLTSCVLTWTAQREPTENCRLELGGARKRTTNSEVVGSLRGDPTETKRQLAQAQVRKLLGKGHSITDVQLQALSDQVSAFASVIVDVFLEERRKNPLASESFQVSEDSTLAMAVQ